ncbi:MAG TPA: gamma-glutamyl-gamma-aminobutyrate hydrolase family protein [Solirubrobacteraceae bacterium]|nr:gamma-glutamyl-gamma-aminobutyrate hydrolase family protein [Solirubrobacteraceae bacterium]
MARDGVAFVIMEHAPAIDRALKRHFEAIRRRMQSLVDVPVRSRHYCDAGDFGTAAAVILSGSFAPWSVHDPAALARLGERVWRFDRAVLGICGGMQQMAVFAGGEVGPRRRAALGYGAVEVLDARDLLGGLGPTAVVYEHHAWDVVSLPENFVVLARSADCAVEAVRARDRAWWGTQFHPERFNAQHSAGARVLRNFFALAGVGARRC